jgi:hypothetical protein
MFRYNKDKVNKEVDELKKLLAITKGYNKNGKSISASFLKEEVDLIGNPTTPPAEPAEPTMGGDISGGMDAALSQTDGTKEIEKAIQNSTITYAGPLKEAEDGEQIVKGYVGTSDDSKGLYFKFSSKETKPVIQTKKAITLDDDLLKSIQQIGTYFDTWKSNVEK